MKYTSKINIILAYYLQKVLTIRSSRTFEQKIQIKNKNKFFKKGKKREKEKERANPGMKKKSTTKIKINMVVVNIVKKDTYKCQEHSKLHDCLQNSPKLNISAW
jgi:hypothetical protein